MTFSKLLLWLFMTGLLIGAPADEAWSDPAPRAVDQAVRQGFSEKAEGAGRGAKQARQQRSDTPVTDTEESSPPDAEKNQAEENAPSESPEKE